MFKKECGKSRDSISLTFFILGENTFSRRWRRRRQLKAGGPKQIFLIFKTGTTHNASNIGQKL
jgi:hypothetical protein